MAPSSALDYVSTAGSEPSSPTSPKSERSRRTQSTAASSAPLVRPPTNQPSGYGQITSSNEDKDEGWPLVAKLMAHHGDFEAFSRFRDLNVKNLLYYQVEIDSIRHQLEEQERRDRRDISTSNFAKFADRLINSETDQWDLVIRLRECLKEYNNALLQYSKISSLPEPRTRNMEELSSWLVKPNAGNFCIAGRGSLAWGHLYQDGPPNPSIVELVRNLLSSIFWKRRHTPTKPDLVVPRAGKAIDGLTRWIADEWSPFWFGLCHRGTPTREDEEGSSNEPKQPKPPVQDEVLEGNARLGCITSYRESTMSKFTSSVATVVACILPTVAIGILSTAEGNVEKLLYIGGFTALFSIGLMLLTTGASRVEIFTATAAFSAVLVVFVQNQ